MAHATNTSGNHRHLSVLTWTVMTAAVLAALYWLHAILIPLALALLITFLLTPVVTALQRSGLGRIAAVAVATVLAASVVFALAWTVAGEFGKLLHELPNYTGTVKTKIEQLRSASEDGIVDRLNTMMHDLSATWKSSGGGPAPDNTQPVPVVIDQGGPVFLRWLPTFLPPVVELLTQAGLIVVLVIFMLLDRENLRNRCIRLIGHGHLTTTTKAVDEAGRRISRFLLMQLVFNACYGLLFGIGMAIIGVEHAALWGFLAGLLRYVPYVGAPVAVCLPLAMSLVQSESWLVPVAVLGLFAVLESVAYSILEPLLYGRSTGVSALALLTAAAFWAFFWGPIGLVLSCPLTVCLAVLGKYVSQLQFLGVLLSDEPALEESVVFYQRLSAGDQDEAATLAKNYEAQHSAEEMFDALFVPALASARRDFRTGEMAESEKQRILDALRAIMTEWKAKHDARPAIDAGECTATSKPVRVIGVAAKDEIDALAVDVVRLLLDPLKWKMEIASAGVMPTELLAAMDEHEAALMFIGAVQPGSLGRARYLCKQLRKKKTASQIVVGLWGQSGSAAHQIALLRDAGADRTETTILGLREYLRAWQPVLLDQHASASPVSEKNGQAQLAAR